MDTVIIGGVLAAIGILILLAQAREGIGKDIK
jgi:hypothetical protein